MASLKFAKTHNLVAFLSKREESDGFDQIVDFLNANPINYALTVNPTVYTSCIEQFWTTTKAKMVNGERQLQALVDGKKIVITKSTIRRDLHLEDAEGTDCLPTATIFKQLTRMGAKNTAWNKFSSIMASAIICLATNQKFNFSKYIFENMVKNLEGGVKFLMYPRFVQVFLDKQVGDMSTHTRTYDAPCHTKKIFANMKREGKGFSRRVTPLFQTMMVQAHEEMDEGSEIPTDPHHTPTITQPSTSQPQKKQPRRKQRKDTEISQDSEIAELKRKVKKLEKKKRSRTLMLKRLRKVGRTARIEFSEDEDEQEVKVEKVVSTAEVTTASATTTTVDELTLAQTLIEIKAAKPKAVTTAATTTTTFVTRPKARGAIVQEPSEFTTTISPSQPLQLPQAKEKGKAKMVEPEKPLKKKYHIIQKEEEATIALIKSWNNVQAMIEADRLLAKRLQAREQEELTDEEKARLFVELLEKRKKHFASLRAQEKRNKPPTKAQKKSTMSTYLKHVARYKQSQLKNKSFAKIQKLFDKAMKRVNMFLDMDTEMKKSSKKAEAEMTEESSSKRAGEELRQEKAKKQKIDDDQEEAEMKRHMGIVLNKEEIAVDAIPLATKPPIIVDWKIIKEGKIGYFQIIRADGSSKGYSSMIQMLQSIDREDLEALWKLVKAKHGLTRPEEAYERVLWGNLKVMFEPDVECKV
ncbi:hypothetical protein Tco_0590085 [Tanacetum coccineum]